MNHLLLHHKPATEDRVGRKFQRQNEIKIDIEISDENRRFGIFIENKIGAPLGKKQAEKYWKTLCDIYGENGILSFITESGRHQISPNINMFKLNGQMSTIYLVNTYDKTKI